ncbi:MAG: RNA polymerase sigma-70 factor [Bacteroidia bacterium]|nr:RNA polymerase sigma-70 factor [Bacteroidia bacterium]
MKDQKWFRELFHAEYEKLCRMAYKYIPDKSSCEDIVQECFINLWEQYDKQKIINVSAYLSTAVKNKCISFLRKQNFEVSIEDDRLQNSILQLQVPDEEKKPDPNTLITDAISLLPTRCKIIFKMSRFEKKTYQQIADDLNLSIKTVESQMGKSIKIMRQYVQDHPEFFLWSIIFLTTYF